MTQLAAKIYSLILYFLLTVTFCFSQEKGQDRTQMDSIEKEHITPNGFKERQQKLSTIFKTIENKQYDNAIDEANKIILEAISYKDTVNLRDAYKLVSKAYDYKKDIKQRNHFNDLYQNIAVFYGYHLDEGLAYFENRDLFYEREDFVYDELLLLEDKVGHYTFEQVSSPTFKDRYSLNNTIEIGEERYKASTKGVSYYSPRILFNQDAVYWVKVKVVGSHLKTDNYFFLVEQHWGSSWDKVDMYVVSKNSSVAHFKFGLVLSPNEKDFNYNHNLFEIDLPKNEVKTLYLRLEGTRKGNRLTNRPNHMSLALENMSNFLEFDGFYHIPDSITHTHEGEQPSRYNHILNAVNYIEDKNDAYQLNDVVRNWDDLNPKYPYQLSGSETSKFYWAKLNIITNAQNIGRHSFMISGEWDDVDIYIPTEKGEYIKSFSGSNIKSSKKSVPGLYNIFHVYTNPKDTLSVYLNLKSNKNFPFSVTRLNKFEIAHFDEAELWYTHNQSHLPYYIMAGLLFILLLYYLILFIINKEQTHLYLALMFLGFFIAVLNNTNLITQFPRNRLVEIFGVYISFISIFRFAERILNIRELSKRLHKLNRVVFYLLIATGIVFTGFLSSHYLFESFESTDSIPSFILPISILILVVFVILLLEATHASRKGMRYAKFFLLFLLLLVSSVIVNIAFNLEKELATVLTFALLTLSFLALMLITAFRLKQLRQDQAEKEKAQASEKAKHQFLANMSHEIRTPMNAIKGMTDILIRRQPKEEQIEYLDSIKQSSDSLLIIINDILDLSKIESGKIELENQPFSIHDVMKNVNTMMQFKAEEKGLQLQNNMSSENLIVQGDATRLRQILINLISNAIKFTEKGVVTTTIKSEQIEDKLQLHFTVSDTGIGIDNNRLEKIFKSFEQAYNDTSRKFGGTGLGLSISKKLIELHNGKIWVESEKGKGSQFHFMIPYEIAEETTILEPQTNSENNSNEQLKGIKVLLVEDNQFNVVVAQEELEDAIENVQLDLAENGAIAVEKLKSNDYDVILMDIQMPKMNGYEATKAIRNLDTGKSKTPIIAMTANVLKEEVDACYKAGMNDFIGKPFDTEKLLHKIHNLIKI
jgi:signal transduction histidine kinase/ActR/RegA family two-component response regulator